MYQSRQYLEICGKYVVNPYSEQEELHGVSLHKLVWHLHESCANSATDFKAILLGAIEKEIGLQDMQKASLIYQSIMTALQDLGIEPEQTAH